MAFIIINIVLRIIIIILKSYSDKINAEIEKITKIKTRRINQIYARAIIRGFDLNQRPLIIQAE